MSASQDSTVDSASHLLDRHISTDARSEVRHAFQNYARAAVFVLASSCLLQWAAPVLGDRSAFSFFLVPVVLAAWRCGLGPSVFATALSVLAALWFFIEPGHRLAPSDEAGWVGLTSFLVGAAIICGCAEAMHRARRRLDQDAARIKAQQDVLAALTQSREELERLVEERTAEVQELKSRLEEENCYLRQRVRVEYGHHRLVGQTAAIRRVLAQVEQVAPTNATVLLLGETGTGKELLAETVHELSRRRNRTLVSVNCAAMPAALVESELFGREKGAFTGSLSRQVGRFELADGSTIFLDEIGDLSPEVQAKLLRVLESRQIERLGNPKPVPVDVRIIAATNRDLEKALGDGEFRPDLYYRLNVFPIAVPPLRERRDDIPLLMWAFVDEFAKTFNKNIESVDRESMDALQRYSWPGNVRELRNLIERAVIVATGSKLHIPLPHVPGVAPPVAGRKLQEVEREYLLSILQETGWRIRGLSGAAEKLGLKPTTLEARMLKLGIHRPGSKAQR